MITTNFKSKYFNIIPRFKFRYLVLFIFLICDVPLSIQQNTTDLVITLIDTTRSDLVRKVSNPDSSKSGYKKVVIPANSNGEVSNEEYAALLRYNIV